MSVCLSVKSHLTSGASVCPENTVTYPAGNEGQKICNETAWLQRSSTPSLKAIRTVGHFPAECACVFNHVYAVSGLCGSCRELSSVNCHKSCLQARSVHNPWHGGFCTLVNAFVL